MISHAHSCIFVHIPKCAGTSIEKALGLYGEESWGAQDHRTLAEHEPPPAFESIRFFLGAHPRHALRVFRRNHDLTKTAATTCTRDQYRRYLKFAVVRDPWSRCYSWYRNIIRDPRHLAQVGISASCSFRDFLVNHGDQWGLRPLSFWLNDRKGAIGVDEIIYFDRLGDQWRSLAKRMGLHTIFLPHRLSGGTKNWRDAYTPELIDLVAKRYAEEIHRFGFTVSVRDRPAPSLGSGDSRRAGFGRRDDAKESRDLARRSAIRNRAE